MKGCFFGFFCALVHLFPVLLRAADGTQIWTSRFDGATHMYDEPSALLVDGAGNIYVTGYTSDTNNSYDIVTIKLSSSGVAIWTNFFSGPGGGEDLPVAMVVDGIGNVYVTGSAYIGPGIDTDFVTIKYSSTGLAVWTNFFDGVRHEPDWVSAMAVDAAGNVYVTGTTDWGTSYDYATVKYSSDGLVVWTRIFSSGGGEVSRALALDGNGNVFVTGASPGIETDWDFVTIKYSSAGTPLWTNYFDGLGSADRPMALGADGYGNIYVTGEVTAHAGLIRDFATVKYSNSGAPLWTNFFGQITSDYGQIRAFAVDYCGNTYVTGNSLGVGSNWDYVTIKYSSAGAGVWTNIYSGSANLDDTAKAIALDNAGNVFVTGVSLENGVSSDCTTIKYSSAGVGLWTNHYKGPEDFGDDGSALAVDASGSVYVTGNSYGTNHSDFVMIKYSASDPVTTGSPIISLRVGTPGPSTNTLIFTGNPNALYLAQFATNLTGSPWLPLSTNLANPSGIWVVADDTATNVQRYYRVITPN